MSRVSQILSRPEASPATSFTRRGPRHKSRASTAAAVLPTSTARLPRSTASKSQMRIRPLESPENNSPLWSSRVKARTAPPCANEARRSFADSFQKRSCPSPPPEAMISRLASYARHWTKPKWPIPKTCSAWKQDSHFDFRFSRGLICPVMSSLQGASEKVARRCPSTGLMTSEDLCCLCPEWSSMLKVMCFTTPHLLFLLIRVFQPGPSLKRKMRVLWKPRMTESSVPETASSWPWFGVNRMHIRQGTSSSLPLAPGLFPKAEMSQTLSSLPEVESSSV
mmetsp:Transcript_15986/g.28757  ORF Transcript_15986/g.28757 Transcript_15986/m.28757 type:complete len:280 (-) Transcript_15986:553-1392(-)